MLLYLPDPNFGIERECNEDNNEAQTDLTAPVGLADLTVDVVEVAELACPRSELRTTISNRGAIAVQGFEFAIYAGAPQQGGQVRATQQVEDALAPGQSLDFEVIVEGVPTASQIRFFVVVDPNNRVPECRDDDNIGGADPIGCFVP